MVEQPTFDALVDFIENTTANGLPPEVDEITGRILLDTVGCMVAGVSSSPATAVKAAFTSNSSGPSDIIGTTHQLSPHDAAYVNAYTADVLDFEETLVSHPSAVVVAAALAVGQAQASTWQQVHIAIALGYEIGSRIGRALIPSAPIRREYAAEFWWKPVAATIASGVLLGLDREPWKHAIGYATAASPAARRGGFEFRPLSQLKANYGGQAAAGVLGAYLAANGFLTHRAMLDGPRSYAQLLGSDRWDSDLAVTGLGKDWLVGNVGFKVYPTCLYLHSLLESIDGAVIVPRIPVTDVREVRAFVPAIICRELAEKRPAGVIDAQFSAPIAAATLLLKREPHSQWFDDAWLTNPDMLAVADRVRLIEDIELTRLQNLDGHVRARIEVDLADGTTVRAGVDTVRGNAARPLTGTELRDKFVRSTTPHLGAARAVQAADALLAAAGDARLEPVLDLLRPTH